MRVEKNNDIIAHFKKMGRGDPESGTRWPEWKNWTSRPGPDDLVQDGFGATSPGTPETTR